MEATVSKQFHFSYGHRLINHPGKCSNYHGHNAIVEVQVSGSVSTETGMVLDFYLLDKIVKPLVDSFDHLMILEIGDPLVSSLLNIKGPETVYTLPFPPTAENLASHLLERICGSLGGEFSINVTFWETTNCSAQVAKIRDY